jgi:hypothetical protein
MESLERVFLLEVRGVVSRRFKIGNTGGEYTGCGSSPHSPEISEIIFSNRIFTCINIVSQRIGVAN